MRGVLRVKIVVLAAPAAILPVRRRDLENLDPGVQQKAQEPGTIGGGGLDANTLDLPEGSPPDEHLPTALRGRGEAPGSDKPILFADDRRDMQILVGVHAADGATSCAFPSVHFGPPGSTVVRRLPQDRVRGQDSDATVSQVRPFLGHRPRRGKTAPQGVLGRPTGPRKDISRLIGVRVKPHRDAPWRHLNQTVHRGEGQVGLPLK